MSEHLEECAGDDYCDGSCTSISGVPVIVDFVNHPPHYMALPGVGFECIELARRLTFDVGNAVKYMWRTDRKNGRQDIEKAHWYITDACENFDLIHVDLRPEIVTRTNELLELVAKNQPTSERGWFFYALYRGNIEEALGALNAILESS